MPSDAPEPEVDVVIGGGGLQDVSSAPRTGNVPGPRGRIITGGRAIGNRVVGGRTVDTVSVGRRAPVQISKTSKSSRSQQFSSASLSGRVSKAEARASFRTRPRGYAGGTENGITFLSGEQAVAKMKEASHYSHNPDLERGLTPHIPGNPTLRAHKDFVGTFFGKGVQGDQFGGRRYGKYLYKPALSPQTLRALYTGKHRIAVGLEVRDFDKAQELLKQGIVGTTHPAASEDIMWAFGMHPDYNLKLHGEAVHPDRLPTGLSVNDGTSADLGGWRVWGQPRNKLTQAEISSLIDNRPMQEFFPRSARKEPRPTRIGSRSRRSRGD